MTIPDSAPRGLGWLDTRTTKALTTGLSIIAILLSGFLLFRLQAYIDCVAEAQSLAGERTRAIAAATDAERVADAALVAGPRPGGPDAAELRRQDVAARNLTDRVRAMNPPPSAARC